MSSTALPNYQVQYQLHYQVQYRIQKACKTTTSKAAEVAKVESLAPAFPVPQTHLNPQPFSASPLLSSTL
jgi:hypothetical protein